MAANLSFAVHIVYSYCYWTRLSLKSLKPNGICDLITHGLHFYYPKRKLFTSRILHASRLLLALVCECVSVCFFSSFIDNN